MKLKAQYRPSPLIPTASMADIAFLLIIFFILTYNIQVDRARVLLPKSMVRQEVPKQSAFISVDPKGVIRVSDGVEMSHPVFMDDVMPFALTVVSAYPNRAFVIKAHDDTPYRVVDQILDQLKKAKAEKIYLLTDQETVKGGVP